MTLLITLILCTCLLPSVSQNWFFKSPLGNSATILHPVPPCPEKVFGVNFPLAAIISYPGSGNTWVRHLIETATGFYTGSLFNDSALFDKGFKGEILKFTDFKQLIGIKHHSFHGAGYINSNNFSNLIRTSKESKCLILLRNPYDAYLAEFSRHYSNTHESISKLTDYQFRKKFQTERVVSRFYIKQLWYYTYWDSYNYCLFDANNSLKTKSVYFVFYEDLKRNLVEELRRIISYLQEYDKKRFKECVIDKPQYLEGSFRRKKHFPKDAFTNVAKIKIDLMVKKLNKTFKILPASYLSTHL